ncbi:MAG: hypothetical protein KIT84_05515 [Labilithrix sp.]|nr:hypothetical protein [Labilithrix sp.]MCW5810446.1 hypothetical protein [Labilithrix sp.]
MEPGGEPRPSRIDLPPRLRRTLELVYGVQGVTAARVWHWPGRVSVGIRPGAFASPSELLDRVERAVAGLREPEETWDFGLLEMAEDTTPATISHA